MKRKIMQIMRATARAPLCPSGGRNWQRTDHIKSSYTLKEKGEEAEKEIQINVA